MSLLINLETTRESTKKYIDYRRLVRVYVYDKEENF